MSENLILEYQDTSLRDPYMLPVAADKSNYLLDDVFTGLDSIKTNTRYKWASLMVLPRLTCGFPACCNPDEAPKRE